MGQGAARKYLESVGGGEDWADGIEADVLGSWFREAAVRNVLVHDSQIDGELVCDGKTSPESDGKAKAEVLALGVGGAGGVSEHEADAGFEVGNDGPAFLDEVVAGAEEGAREPWIGSLDNGPEHAAKEKFGITTVPTFVADLVELPSDGDELGEINIIVGIVNGAEASGFSREGDDILAKKGRDVWVGRSGSRGGR